MHSVALSNGHVVAFDISLAEHFCDVIIILSVFLISGLSRSVSSESVKKRVKLIFSQA